MAALRKIERQTGIVTTTDATVTTLITFTMPTGSVCSIDAEVVSRSSSGDGARTRKTQTFRNVSGTVTAIGALLDIAALATDISLATVAVTMTISGATVLIRVTGVVATTIDWHGEITVYIN